VERLFVPGAEIGASVRDLRDEDLSSAKLQPGGVLVQDVREGSPAARAGLRSGDIIVQFDGERVRGVRHFSRLVQETPAGRTVKSEFVRGTERRTVDITPQATEGFAAAVLPDLGRRIERGIRALPPDFDVDSAAPADWWRHYSPGMSRARLGVTLAPLTDQLASYFGVKEGVLVSAVEADSPAAQAGIRAGDVITAINGRAVADPGEAIASIREASGSMEVRLTRDKKEMTLKATLPERRPPARARIPV
jgi:serine protease Do